MAKISSPLTEIPIGKTEISVTEPGHPLIWTHRKSTGLIWRDPKFARPHWISCQKSIPFVCAQISGIATGQTLQLLKKREIIAFFLFFKSESVYYLSRGEVKNAPWRENLDCPQLCFQQISEETCFFLICQKDSSLNRRNGASSVLWFLNDLAFTGSELWYSYALIVWNKQLVVVHTKADNRIPIVPIANDALDIYRI